MSGPVLLNNVDHHALHVTQGHGARFGDAVNQALVFPTEFEELQREYAIVFRQNDAGEYRAFVLLGLDPDENLFLDEDRWDARYVPALHARGPFSIGVAGDAEDGEPMIHVDPDHPRIAAQGAPVFREHGGNAPLLDHISEVLQRLYTGSRVAPAMFAAFAAAGLIAPVTLRLELDADRRYNVPDCFTIDAERLAQLDGETLARLHRDDYLRPALWVESSLGNVRHLLDRKVKRDAGG